MKTEKKLKKLSLKYRYLTIEMEEVKDDLLVYQGQFHKYLISLEKKHEIQIFKESSKKIEKSCNRQDEDIVPLDDKRDKKQDEIFKETYREIAIKAHPDKNNGDEDMAKVFRRATRAKNDSDLMSMIDICVDLDIPVPDLDDDHFQILELNIKKVQERINGLKNLDAYVWATADDTLQKKIEKNILKIYKNIN